MDGWMDVPKPRKVRLAEPVEKPYLCSKTSVIVVNSTYV